jgi:hypothetical protein
MTAICAVPAIARLAAGTLATSCVADVKVVGNSAPFHSTTEADRKFCPVTVRENAAAPALADV